MVGSRKNVSQDVQYVLHGWQKCFVFMSSFSRNICSVECDDRRSDRAISPRLKLYDNGQCDQLQCTWYHLPGCSEGTSRCSCHLHVWNIPGKVNWIFCSRNQMSNTVYSCMEGKIWSAVVQISCLDGQMSCHHHHWAPGGGKENINEWKKVLYKYSISLHRSLKTSITCWQKLLTFIGAIPRNG